MKQGAGYGIKVPGEHRFRFPGNWKIQLENTTDAYHFPLVHKSFLSSVDEQTLALCKCMRQGILKSSLSWSSRLTASLLA